MIKLYILIICIILIGITIYFFTGSKVKVEKENL